MNEMASDLSQRPARSVRFLLACVLACCAWHALPARADAQEVRETVESDPLKLRFLLPFELGQGPRFDGTENGFAWMGQASVLPGLAFCNAELSALVAATYRRSKADALLGARLSHVLVPFLEHTVSLRLAVQGAYAVDAEDADGMLGVLFDLAGILRLGAWAGRDFAAEHFYALVTVGTNVLTWSDPVGAVIEAGPMEDVGDGR